jgi:hypothetical protein
LIVIYKKNITIVLILIIWLSIIIILTHNSRLLTKRTSLITSKKNIIKPVKVFQIGFSKCGTTSLSEFFNKNGILSVHHDGGMLATSIYNNYLNDKPLLSLEYAGYNIYTDMERLYDIPQISIGQQLFVELDKSLPGSKFILNVRNKQDWLKSRAKHPVRIRGLTLLQISAEIQNISDEEMLTRWSLEWDEHIRAVQAYFKDRPNDLLIFDIDKDPPEKLVNFLREYFILDPKLYGKENKTAYRWIKELYGAIL